MSTPRDVQLDRGLPSDSANVAEPQARPPVEPGSSANGSSTVPPQTSYWNELGRKAIHIASAGFAITYGLTDFDFMVSLLVPIVAGAVFLEIARQIWRPLNRAILFLIGAVARPSEAHTWTGATYVAIANLLAMCLFPKDVAMTSLIFLAVCDAFASLVGLRAGGPRLFGKSATGSAAFLLSAFAIGYATFPHARLVGIAGALVATLAEALPALRWGPLRLDDNLLIPLLAGAVMTAMRYSGW